MVLLSAVWGLQQVAVKGAVPFMAPVYQIAIRSAVAAVAVGALVVIRRETGALRSGTWKPGTLVGLLFALEFLLVAEGLRFTSASHMSIFLYTAPIFAALGLHFRSHEERLTVVQWMGVGLAFVGVVVSFLGRGAANDGQFGWLGDLMGIAAGASYGATTISIRFSRLSNAPATVTLFYQLAGAAIVLLTASVLTDQTGMTPSWTLAFSLVYQIVIVSTLSFLAWFALLKVYLASRLSILSLMTPIFGVAFGILALGERLDPRFVAGAVLVLAGILLVGARDVLRTAPMARLHGWVTLRERSADHTGGSA
ncbi:DMT family transporter [Sphingomonas sp. UV9]|nr:DMT family transporter [Sphingomonas sp. UV9]